MLSNIVAALYDTRMIRFAENSFHIAADEATAGCIKHAFNTQCINVLVNKDPLSAGPIDDITDPSDWLSLRRNYWCSLFDEPVTDLDLCSFNLPDLLLLHEKELKQASSVVLWAGNTLEEALFVSFTLVLFDKMQVPLDLVWRAQALSLQYNDFGCYSYMSSIDAKKHSTLTALSNQDLKKNINFWKLYAGQDPQRINHFINATEKSDYFRNLVLALIKRYPSFNTSLDFWSEQILNRCTSTDIPVVQIIGDVLACSRNNCDQISDSFLYHKIKEMSQSLLRHPLLKLTGHEGPYRHATTCLTAMGQTVQEGHLNQLSVNMLSAHVGGVHLSSAEDNIWCYDKGNLSRFKI
jgi:Domain of unknown function (DUF1835)